MKNFLKPSYVLYSMTEEDFLWMVNQAIKELCGVNITPHIQVDSETYAIKTVIYEDEISENDIERLEASGFRYQEWYETTQSIINYVFGTTGAYAVADAELYDEDGIVYITVGVPFTDFQSNKIEVATPKGTLSAIAINDTDYPCIQIHVGEDIGVITEFDSLNDSIRTRVFNHKSDEPLEIYEW